MIESKREEVKKKMKKYDKKRDLGELFFSEKNFRIIIIPLFFEVTRKKHNE